MGKDDGVARDCVIVAATRRALVDDLRRARSSALLGVLLALLGCGVAVGAWVLPLGFTSLVVCGGVGLMLIPCGLAILARAVYMIASSWRRLRALDARTALPVARVRAP